MIRHQAVDNFEVGDTLVSHGGTLVPDPETNPSLVNNLVKCTLSSSGDGYDGLNLPITQFTKGTKGEVHRVAPIVGTIRHIRHQVEDDLRPTGITQTDLVGGAVKLLKKAESWYTIAYRVEPDRLVVRGRRGPQQFMAVWRNGKADVAYWWTREHEAQADLPRELVRWTTPVPTPVKVSFAELKRKVSE